MNDFNFASEELDLLTKKKLKRELKIISTAPGPWVELSNGKRVLQFASNNYLGLANHPEIINAAKAAISKYGTGSTGSRLLSGTTELHITLEKEIALFEGSESAIFFSSGYLANTGTISALIGKEDGIYSDELNHASILDGMKLSGAQRFIYHHLDTNHLEDLIQKNKDRFRRNFIITDTVFSMDGDLAPLKEIGQLVEKYNCIPIVDEAHATGIFGKSGAGLVEELDLKDFFQIKIGTCSKALGVEGGFCSGPKNVIQLLQNKARSFMFSTSPGPSITSAVLKSLDLVKDSNWRKEKLWQIAQFLHSGLKKNYKLKINGFHSPIIIIYFNTIEEAEQISARLFNECHIWAPLIRPPTVKEPRIRITPTATHSEEDMRFVIRAFEHLSKDLKVEPLRIHVNA